MITPRTTRLVRAADLRSFRQALAMLAVGGAPLDARDRLVIVPTRAAAAHLVRAIEDGLEEGHAAVLPEFITRGELAARLFERLDDPPETASRKGAPYTDAERDALLMVSCRAARDAGAVPPFHIRPGLVAAMLDFYDSLTRQQKSIDDFERLTIGRLDAGAGTDRGADRLIRQTAFFAAAFREFERRCAEAGGVDEHTMLARAVAHAAGRPWRHLIVAVRDRAGDRYGLYPIEWDALARIPGLERLDVVVTDTTLAGAFHERIHQLLPGLEEVRAEDIGAPARALPAPSLLIARDREEELIAFARSVRAAVRAGDVDRLDRVAVVVQQRLPYVYLAREVFRSARIPCQMFDALPLAAEPFAAALDLLLSFVSANFARVPAIALLSSPHFQFAAGDGARIGAGEVAALDRALSESGYLGDADALDALTLPQRAERAGEVLRSAVRDALPLRIDAAVAAHLDCVLAFLGRYQRLPDETAPAAAETGDTLRARQLRARGAIVGLLRSMRDAYRRFDDSPVPFDEVAAMIRRGIEAHTFAPRTGDAGVHVVDAASAAFGDFDMVQLAGLVDGEWPDRPRRNIFYSPGILRDLGWPADADRLEGVRGAFRDLLRLPARRLTVSTFSLEHDAIVAPSPLLDDAVASGLEQVDAQAGGAPRSLEDELLGMDPVHADVLERSARTAADWRLQAAAGRVPARGMTTGHTAKAYAVSALERYLDCPFQFFARNVLQIDELPEDEPSLSPRARGRFIHEVFQRFFEEWDRRGGGVIDSEKQDAARAVFADVAAPLLERLPESDAALERARLFGSPVAVGIVDVVLGIEAAHPAAVVERWLEYRLEGDFSLNGSDGRLVPLKGVADRIDLLAGNQLRVIDYKTGYAPEKKRALQIPVYALCAQERLREQGRGSWQVDEGAYVAFTGKKTLVQVIKAGKDEAGILADARARLLDVVDGVERGEFPPRPHDPRMCSWCAYPSVCRKDYVGDE